MSVDGYSEISNGDRRLMNTARAYVAARIANDGAEPRDWMARLAEVDRTWHELIKASGLSPEQEKP